MRLRSGILSECSGSHNMCCEQGTEKMAWEKNGKGKNGKGKNGNGTTLSATTDYVYCSSYKRSSLRSTSCF